MQKIHVLLKKEELDSERLDDKVVIVLDILFATSTIVTAMANGAVRVQPARDAGHARELAAVLPVGSVVLAGELNAERLPGFMPPTPLALLCEHIADRTLVYSTTNGTVALSKAWRAPHVYAGALLNGEALVRTVAARHRDETVLIVCSGSADNFNLEDFYGAGYLVAQFAASGERYHFTDAALAARMLYEGSDALACLNASRVGRRGIDKGWAAEVAHSARTGCYDCVPLLRDGFLVPA